MQNNSAQDFLWLKMRKLLEIVVKPSQRIRDDSKFNRLLQELSIHKKKREAVLYSFVEHPLFMTWLVEAVNLWDVNKFTPRAEISSFTLNLAALITSNEYSFSALNTQNFYIKLVKILKARDIEAPSCVKIAYTKVLSSFLEHQSGVTWMIGSNCWEDILKLSLTSQDFFAIKESRKFLSKILTATVDVDETFSCEVVRKIMSRLGGNVFREVKSSNHEDAVAERLKPRLRLLGNILEHFLENSGVEQKWRILLLFLNHFHAEDILPELTLLSSNPSIAFDAEKIVLLIEFLEFSVQLETQTLNYTEIQKFVSKLTDFFTERITEETNFETVTKFCDFGQLYWKLISEKVEIINAGNLMNRATQLIYINVLPLIILTLKYFPDSMEIIDNDELRDSYYYQALKSFNEDSLRICYNWRDVLWAEENEDFFDNACKVLVQLMKSRKYLPKDRAVAVFLTVFYLFKDYVRAIKDAHENSGCFMRNEDFLVVHFDCMTAFVQDFEITWKDSLEAIDLLDIVLDYLLIHSWSPKVVKRVLKLMNVSLKYCMPANLVLLVDETKDSTLTAIIRLISNYLKADVSVVWIAALEVVFSISNLAKIKFPSLQKVLMDSDLPGLVVKMATQDGESFVRATAIKCLQEMIQVEEIWNNALQSQDLSEKMRQILINETEGIVRVEAATFMCISYENNHFPDDSLEKVYETMIHSSTTDLHWEVKVRALSFWDKVIHNHLQHQGMIDGSFPSVTFSKEHRKIVTLTDAEIKKRLQKILGQLSCIGCLGVLISAIRDDCDMEVSKTAVKITQKLVELLKKYSINADSTVPISPQPTENGMSSSASISSGISGDDFMGSPATNANTELNEEIIDQIVNSRDVNLLQNVYTPSDYGSVLNYDVQVRKIVSPNEFLLFTQQDLNAIINEKKNWLNGIEDLGSLLDDMLKTYDDDVNSMDCY